MDFTALSPVLESTALGVLIARGPDARSFLQGQLSNDLAALTPRNGLLASCNSPQGRVQAVLTLLDRGDEIWLLLPEPMVQTVRMRLQKYVLRAKVTLEDGSAHWKICGLMDPNCLPLLELIGLSLDPLGHMMLDAISVIRWPDPMQRYA